tara:strand:+ start:93 stop:3740 length:3648 start_codon:yes stop_codon:yes gene_type:complete
MINRRLFGADIDTKVKKILEARQKASSETRDPNEEIIPSDYPDDRNSYYKYNELHKNQFNGELDLSSRTPFVRMWTAIELFQSADIIEDLAKFDPNIRPTDDVAFSTNESWVGLSYKDKTEYMALRAKDFAAEYPDSRVVEIDGVFYVKEKDPERALQEKTFARKIYKVGNHTLNYSTNQNPNESLSMTNNVQDPDMAVSDETGTELVPEQVQGVFPQEQKSNEFLKPPSGILSVSSDTEGTLGVTKSTTVNFIVHNFNDFDKIYNRYFLKPGAQIFVDFGWDVSSMYDPEDLLDSGDITSYLYGEKEKGDRYEGYVTKNRGMVEVVEGIVTDYESKITENGSVECSLTIISKNNALLSSKFEKESFTAHITDIINHGVKYLAIDPLLKEIREQVAEEDSEIGETVLAEMDEYGNYTYFSEVSYLSDTVQLRDIPNEDTSTNDLQQFNENINILAEKYLSGKNLTPFDNSIRTGVFINKLISSEIFLSMGFIEDLIINSQFGFGDGNTGINQGSNLSIRIDSSNSFTTYSSDFYNRQKLLDGVSSESRPLFIYPKWWGDADPDFGVSGLRPQDVTEGGSYTFQQNKIPSQAPPEDLSKSISAYPSAQDEDYESMTEYDKRPGIERIPIREVFINAQVIIDSIADSKDGTLKSMIESMLEKINKDSYGVFDWKVKTGVTDSEISIVDMNLIDVQQKINMSGKVNEEENEAFSNLFMFNIMSENSIVKGYDVKLSVPGGDVGSMYAIQGLTHGSKIFPINDNIDRAVALSALDTDNLSYRYQPATSEYRARQMAASTNKNATLVDVYQSARNLLDNNTYDVTAVRNYSSTNDIKTSLYLDNLKEDDSPNPDSTEESETEQQKMENQWNDMIDKNIRIAQAQGKRVVNNFSDYYSERTKVETIVKRANPLPLTLTLTIYGISSLVPGDIFRVNYLPQIYKDNVYFQVIKVSHSIGSDGWYTTLETQFRIKPEVKKIQYSNVITNKHTILSPRILLDLGLEEHWQHVGPTMRGTVYWPTNKFQRNLSFLGLIANMSDISVKSDGSKFSYIEKVLNFTWMGKDMAKYSDSTYGGGIKTTAGTDEVYAGQQPYRIKDDSPMKVLNTTKMRFQGGYGIPYGNYETSVNPNGSPAGMVKPSAYDQMPGKISVQGYTKPLPEFQRERLFEFELKYGKNYNLVIQKNWFAIIDSAINLNAMDFNISIERQYINDANWSEYDYFDY